MHIPNRFLPVSNQNHPRKADKEKYTCVYAHESVHMFVCMYVHIYTLCWNGNISILTYLKLNKQFVYIFLRYFPDIRPSVIYWKQTYRDMWESGHFPKHCPHIGKKTCLPSHAIITIIIIFVVLWTQIMSFQFHFLICRHNDAKAPASQHITKQRN